MQKYLKTKKDKKWDIFYFYSSLWVDCTEAFSGIPLSVLLLNYAVVCISKFLYCNEQISFLLHFYTSFYCLIYVSVYDQKNIFKMEMSVWCGI